MGWDGGIFMNVVYCCDAKWYQYAKVSAESVLKHNKANVYFVTDSAERDERFHYVPMPDMSEIQKGKGLNFTEYTFIRLYLADLLPVEKVIYLDTDTLCVGSLADLYAKEPECVMGVAENKFSGGYINTGVMLLNLREYGKHKHEMIQAVNTHSYRWPDQDAINAVCKVENIENKWNYCVNVHVTGECENPAIIHYIWQKPWNVRCEKAGLWYAEANIEFKEPIRMKETVIFNGKECEVKERYGEDVVIKVDGEVRYVAGNLLGKKAEPKAEPVKKKKSAKSK